MLASKFERSARRHFQQNVRLAWQLRKPQSVVSKVASTQANDLVVESQCRWFSSSGTTPVRELTSEIRRVSGIDLAKSWLTVRDKPDIDLLSLHPLFIAPSLSNPMEIFANSEINLDSIKVLGFDFDFTLVSYTTKLQEFIYDKAKEYLVKELRYPEDFNPKFDKAFAIRGLMFDTSKGLMVKLNSSFNISLDCVFRGRRRLTKEEALQAYGGSIHVTKEYRKANMRGILDLFSLAEACLICDVVQYMDDHDVPYTAASLFADVNAAIAQVHTSGVMHKTVMRDVALYVHKSSETKEILMRMKRNGKQTFLLSNSSIEYIDAGMKYIVGDDWMSCFDVVITSSQKPSFYTSCKKFRMVDTGNLLNRDAESKAGKGPEDDLMRLKWAEVKSLEQDHVYSGGNLDDLMKLTGWKGSEVLYIGDHVYTDLLEPSRSQGWWTGAIIRELEHEIATEATMAHQAMNLRMQILEEIMRRVQWAVWEHDDFDPNRIEAQVYNPIENPNTSNTAPFAMDMSSVRVEDMREDQGWNLQRTLNFLEYERTKLRQTMNETHNVNFGSVFRAQHASSLFADGLGNFVDLYTSRLANFSRYRKDYRFYPRKRGLPHEVPPRQNMVREILGSTMMRVLDANEIGLPRAPPQEESDATKD